jgi:hypothetical protein
VPRKGSWLGTRASPPPRPPLSETRGESFLYIDADSQDAAGGKAADWRPTFFARVEALCAKRAAGVRPLDVGCGGGDFEVAQGESPWGRLGGLKRRSTAVWPWSRAEGGGDKGSGGVERRRTMPH